METPEKQKTEKISDRAPKLRAAILFFIKKAPNVLHRISLCKQLYYADGHYYQKFSESITEFDYLHIEGSPQPLLFNELMNELITGGEVEVIPQVVSQDSGKGPIKVLKGLSYRALVSSPDIFTREEKKVLNSVALTFKGDLTLETRYYPNLYQQYTQTGLYEKIPLETLPDGTRPRLQWKAWADKVFRLLWQ